MRSLFLRHVRSMLLKEIIVFILHLLRERPPARGDANAAVRFSLLFFFLFSLLFAVSYYTSLFPII